jgi:DNA polymerase (family X)
MNKEIAQLFHDIADILEIKGANRFRVRAYQRAAQNIGGLTQNIELLIKEDRLKEIPGVGKDLAERIKEFSSTGKVSLYEDLKKSIPEGLIELLDISSIGPRTAKLLYEELKIKNVADLEKAIAKCRLNGIFGIKEKTIENIRRGIELLKMGKERMTLAQATVAAEEFVESLKKLPEAKRISTAGSLRRQKETVRDIDMLAASAKPQKIMDVFLSEPCVKEILAQGRTKSSVRTKEGIQVDCRVVEEKSFGAALLYFTGSKSFNIKLRQLAIRKGLKVNEYGVFKKDKFICGKTEEEAFKALGLAFIEPELREDTGEVELAQKDKLPKLIRIEDIRGDLHAHSSWSDGQDSIAKMANKAKTLGYSYIAITDHSQSLKVARGLSTAELAKKKREIEKVNRTLKGIRVLYGTEVDIDSQGNIDYKDEILKEFDLVIAAVHTGFKQSGAQLTKRVIRACGNKYVHIIAHPTARLWGERDPYDIDLNEVFKAAADTNTALEINAFPRRLDLNDLNCRRAKEAGVRLAIDTDSHAVNHLTAMKFGIAVARRGWLCAKDVLNTRSLEKLLKTIRK